MGRFLVRAVEWLAAYGAGVVVLSATLPPKRVDELLLAYQAGAGCHGATGERPSAGYPGWVAWSVEDGFAWQAVRPRQEWTLTVTRRDVPAGELTEQVASAAVSASVGGGCVLLVRSTVRAAQDTYEAIRRADSDLMPGQNIDILHSRFPAARSNAGTKAIVFWPLRADGQPSASSPIYSIADLRATRRWLAEKETIVAVPGDVPHIVATTDIETQFDDSAAFHIEDDDMAEATLAWIVAMDIARGAAADWRIPPPHDT